MPPTYEIRADYGTDWITVYQAYPKAIAEPAVQAGMFVPPFSFNRMTWIKPSFLWLMERSNWGQKAGQEHVLAVRITRRGWEEALSLAVLTHPEPSIYRVYEAWKTQFDQAVVYVQWDPERSIQGASLEHRSIQVGLSRHIIRKYVEEWTVEIKDCTPLVRKIHNLVRSGRLSEAKRLLPKERPYPVPEEIARRIGIG
jgi:uncharacterized protein DUF4291